MPQVGAAYNQYKNIGLDIMIVLGENQYRQKPTLSYCKSYASSHGVPPDKVYLDFGNTFGPWEALFTNIYPYLGPDGQLNLPWEAVLDGDNMEYLYSTLGGGYNNINDALNAALAD